jgi:2-C-methyl-D-erythritol 4-phosphate cytidylyltransferase
MPRIRTTATAPSVRSADVKVAMLLLAAGRGSRFGGPVPKAFLDLAGRPLLVRSTERLVQAVVPPASFEVAVVVHPGDRIVHLPRCEGSLRELVDRRGPLHIVDGGATRQESMRNGLAAIGRDVDLVLVHDAARALVPVAATRACIAAAAAVGAALLAVPVADTLKRAADARVCSTLDRADVWLAQTPQVIRRDLLVRALAQAAATGFAGTDDVSLIENLGEPVAIVMGTATNLKITHPDDLKLAAAMLAAGIA